MKKALSILLTLALLAPGFACADEEPLDIVATIFPAYDFAREVAGSRANVTLLLPPGGESHSYEPSPKDIIVIQNADLFVYNGGESDTWVENVLASMGDQAPQTLAMMDCVTPVEEAATLGGEEIAPGEMDEHVWTSPLNAIAIAEALRGRLTALDEAGAAAYADNAAAYTDRLTALDDAFREAVANGTRTTVVFGDRYPFRYLMDELGLTATAAFPGCSEDAEPSAKVLAELIRTVRAESVPVVFYIEFSSRATADALAAETGAKPMLLHSCHNVGAEELASGETYLSLMTKNAEALKEALR